MYFTPRLQTNVKAKQKWKCCFMFIFLPFLQEIRVFMQPVMPSSLECIHPNSKICVDLFIKAHLGTFKVERRNSRNALRCCSGWMWLPEGNITLLHRPVFTVVELWLAMPILHDMMLRNGKSNSVLSFTRQQQSFFINTDFWSLHKIIMDMDLVTFTWGLAGKCWCKKDSGSLSCVSIGSLSPPTVQSRGLTSRWCLEKTGFHLGSNAAWAILKRFLGLFLCTYRAKFEHVSKHCSVQKQHLPLSVVNGGLFISPASLRNDALVFHILIQSFHCILRSLLAVCQNMGPFASSLIRAQLHSCDP